MTRITSNLTLLFKLFIPVFFVAFYGPFTLATWIANEETLGYLSLPVFKYSNTIFFISVLVILYLTVWQLKRVEFSEDYVYVTNYFKTYRYPLEDIETFSKTRLILFTVASIRFKDVTSFGKRIVCLLAVSNLEEWQEKHQEQMERWTKS